MNTLVMLGSIELGMLYAIMALGVFISFRTLNMPDLTVDGSFVLGAAVSAVMCTGGHPQAALWTAFLAGCIAGSATALLHTKLKIQPLLAGILVMLGLWSINLRVMGGKANIPLINKTTVFNLLDGTAVETYATIIIPAVIIIILMLLLYYFLKTELGLVIRATGDNEQMVRALGVNTDWTILIGLAVANGLVALSGALVAQYQSFTDITMGTGMVIIGLASVIIGEVIFGIKSLMRRLIAVVLGAMLYRLVIATAYELGMPTNDFKLVSAIIVALALAMPIIKERFQIWRKRKNNHDNHQREEQENAAN
ncbi:MAG TPA: ABC transporter permease [Syntrophomonadaceae bacterium]|nr:ABC transporter permease [Syntrophomonadaceae bacterium]HPR93599.1 ABC transporter permease [Syntrophomonadaceae bacterium]